MTEDTRSPEARRLMAYGEKVGRGMPSVEGGGYAWHLRLGEWKVEQRLYKVLAGAGIALAVKENPRYLREMKRGGVGVLRAFLQFYRRRANRGWEPGLPVDPFGPTE